MSLLARAIPPAAKSTRVSVSEDGTYAVGPTLDSIGAWLPYGVAPETALNLITVYQCVRVLSNTFAQLPLLLYRRLPNGGKERATDEPLYDTLHLRPNPELSSFAWRRLMMVHLATWGNHYAEIVENDFGSRFLYPIRPDRIEVTRDKSGVKQFDYLSPLGGTQRLKPGTVFHVSGVSTDGLKGRSPIADMRSTIRLARTAEQFGDSFFRNGARPATVLKHPKVLSDPAIQRLAAQMEALRGAGNAGKTVVLEEGMDFAEVGIPPEDAQFMETRLFQKRELAGGFGIPPHKIGDLERATFSNIEHQALEFIQDTMMPYFVNAETEISIQLLSDEPDLFAEFLIDGYLRGDAETRAKAYAIRWQHGTLSADEWRAKENENPLPEGTGSAYYVPVNYQPAGTPVVIPDPAEGSPNLIVVKSMRQFDCPDCGKLINRLAAPGTVGYCKSCKGERTFADAPHLSLVEPPQTFEYDAEGLLVSVS